MASLDAEAAGMGGRRQLAAAGAFILLGIMAGTVPEDTQQRAASLIRSTVLRPFVAMQETLARSRERGAAVEALSSQVDSLSGLLASQATLAEENERLRSLLALSERLGPGFRAASALRPGVPGSESMFLLDVGRRDGVAEGSPVLSAEGLVGVLRQAGPSSSVGIDWTHPDFRASAMVVGTEIYGLVLSRRGAFREADRLILEGVPFNAGLEPGSEVMTSGLGGVYPRGIPIGNVEGVAESEGGWRLSYWIRPRVQPGSVLHVLVPVSDSARMSVAWPDSAGPS